MAHGYEDRLAQMEKLLKIQDDLLAASSPPPSPAIVDHYEERLAQMEKLLKIQDAAPAPTPTPVHQDDRLAQMEKMMEMQANMFATQIKMLTERLAVGEGGVPPATPAMPPQDRAPAHVATPLASWPDMTALPPRVEETVPDFDAVHSRKERTTQSFAAMYATDSNMTVDPSIIRTDAAAGLWGGMPQTQTHVGLRTRGLMLNPTLQQPSVGGLI